MCFNAEVSIITYIVGIIGCIVLLKKKYIPEAIFLLFILQIQLFEYFIWKNQSCNKINNNITKVGIGILQLEPVVLWLAIIFFSEKKLPPWVNYTMILYMAIALINTLNLKKTMCTTVTPESSPHLYWEWTIGKYKPYYYLFFLFTFVILAINGLDNGYHFAIIIALSFIISNIVYGKYKAVGTMWCFIGALLPFFIPYIYKINPLIL